MPELPEVETVARDLRPRIVGATIVGRARRLGADAPDRRRPRRSPTAVAGRRIEAVGRRAKLVVDRAVGRRRADDPSQDDRPAVRRAGRRARGPVRPARARAGRRSRDPLPRHPQVRQDRAVRPRPGHRRARRAEVGGRGGLRRPRPGAARPGVHARATFRRRLRPAPGRLKPLLLDQSFLAGVGNIYADEALWTARLHPLRTAGDAPARRRAAPVRRRSGRSCAEAIERRGSSIDDYTAPDGDGSMQERLQVYQRTGRAVPALRPADHAGS